MSEILRDKAFAGFGLYGSIPSILAANEDYQTTSRYWIQFDKYPNLMLNESNKKYPINEIKDKAKVKNNMRLLDNPLLNTISSISNLDLTKIIDKFTTTQDKLENIHKILLNINKVTLPSSSLIYKQVLQGNDFEYNIPVERKFEQNLSFTLYNDVMLNEMNFFEIWYNYIFDDTKLYMNYYDDYVSDISIYRLDREFNSIHKMEIIECFPVSIVRNDLSYTNTDVETFNVKFAYKKFISKRLDAKDENDIKKETNTADDSLLTTIASAVGLVDESDKKSNFQPSYNEISQLILALTAEGADLTKYIFL